MHLPDTLRCSDNPERFFMAHRKLSELATVTRMISAVVYALNHCVAANRTGVWHPIHGHFTCVPELVPKAERVAPQVQFNLFAGTIVGVGGDEQLAALDIMQVAQKEGHERESMQEGGRL